MRPCLCDPVIACYGGYNTADQIILRGRVLARATPISVKGRQSRLRNFRDFLRLFLTRELRDIPITTIDFGQTSLTDEEGFFTLIITHPQPVPDHITIRAAGADQTHDVVVHNSRDASFGVISDIDDTIMRTGAYSLIKNLWTSATGNVHERKVYADAIALMQQFQQRDGAFFYVSSSPWNLYDYLKAILARTELPDGPFFLRDLGISENQFITGTHGDHKTDAIVTILQANPTLRFHLIGDCGQHDPHIYADIVARYPGRIEKVILRRPHARHLPDDTMQDIDSMKKAGVPVMVDFDYRNLLGKNKGR